MVTWAENITDKCIISKECRERFLPLDGAYAGSLIERGVSFSGISDLRAPYEIARRKPDFHVVIMTLGGEGRFRINQTEGVLRPGDLWVIPAGQPQQYGTDDQWRILFFHITASLPGGTIPFDVPTIIPSRFAAQLESAMTWYLSELLLSSPRSLDAARSYAELIRICLDRALDASRHLERTRVRVRLDELWEAINGNIGSDWTVQKMARRMSLSVSQFRRVVMAHYGSTPQDLLLRMRIWRAQQLLVRTEDTLDVIAERVGYESPFSLSRAFRRAVGVSPRQYRKRSHPEPAPLPALLQSGLFVPRGLEMERPGLSPGVLTSPPTSAPVSLPPGRRAAAAVSVIPDWDKSPVARSEEPGRAIHNPPRRAGQALAKSRLGKKR